MSIKAMNWAWEQALPPNSKLILMALADAADEDGQCWPRVRVIAGKCCTSERTVQRVLKELESRSLLRVETRYRRDGGQSSNGYFLKITTPRQTDTLPNDKLTPGGDACDVRQVAQMSPPSDAALSPHEPPHRTTKESPLLRGARKCLQATTLDQAGEKSGGGARTLIWPSLLTDVERSTISGMLNGIGDDAVQLLLDELSGALATKSIKTSPVRWFRAVVQRFRVGAFVPTVGVSISEKRRRQPVSSSPLMAASRPASPEVRHREIGRINGILGRPVSIPEASG